MGTNKKEKVPPPVNTEQDMVVYLIRFVLCLDLTKKVPHAACSKKEGKIEIK